MHISNNFSFRSNLQGTPVRLSHRISRSYTVAPVSGGPAELRRRGLFSPRRSSTVVSSVFGVGAPEAALVGVVALVVFGPQGLIEAAKAAAGAIRSFQPAIQEINQASSEIRTSITSEMGIDKLQQEFQQISQTTRDSLSLNPSLSSTAAIRKNSAIDASESSTAQAITDPDSDAGKQISKRDQPVMKFPPDTSESLVAGAQTKDEDPDIERKRVESAALAWGGAESDFGQQISNPTSITRRLEDMSLAELEHELQRRKTLIQAIEDLNA